MNEIDKSELKNRIKLMSTGDSLPEYKHLIFTECDYVVIPKLKDESWPPDFSKGLVRFQLETFGKPKWMSDSEYIKLMIQLSDYKMIKIFSKEYQVDDLFYGFDNETKTLVINTQESTL